MPEVRFVGHHLAHATIAFHASDFDAAAVLVIDGNGVEPWELLPAGQPTPPDGIDEGDGFDSTSMPGAHTLDRLAGARQIGRERWELHLDALAVQVAVSAQEAIERVVLHLAGVARALAGPANLCLAGGVALRRRSTAAGSRSSPTPPTPSRASVASDSTSSCSMASCLRGTAGGGGRGGRFTPSLMCAGRPRLASPPFG